MKRKERTLLFEVLAILRDYQSRIDRLGPENLRLRGESFAAWDCRVKRLRLVLKVLDAAARGRIAPRGGP